jgi:hypothetical protein
MYIWEKTGHILLPCINRRNVFGREHLGPIHGSSHIWAPYMNRRKALTLISFTYLLQKVNQLSILFYLLKLSVFADRSLQCQLTIYFTFPKPLKFHLSTITILLFLVQKSLPFEIIRFICEFLHAKLYDNFTSWTHNFLEHSYL